MRQADASRLALGQPASRASNEPLHARCRIFDQGEKPAIASCIPPWNRLMLGLSDASRPRRDVMGSEPPIEVVHFADPWCWWSWGLEPVLQRLKEVYGENLKVTYKMGGQFESLQGWMEEYSVDERTTVDWIRESIELTNMPVRPDYYLRTGVTSSYPACRAFEAARLQSEELAARYLRRMMEAFGLECRPAADDELIRLAEEVGLDGSRVRNDSQSERVGKALHADVDEMHRSGVNFLSLLIRNRDGRQVVKGEVFTAKPFETIIDDLVPGLPKRSPADILEYLEHHRALTPAHEIAEVFRIPDADARDRLEKLAAGGLLTALAFDGGRALA